MFPGSESYHRIGSRLGSPDTCLFSFHPLNGTRSGCRVEQVEGSPVCQSKALGSK